ncbi:MAG: sialate O-acetylesterase [Chitinophagaceae bacterium]
MQKFIKYGIVLSYLMGSFCIGFAEIKLPAIIADNMVLQQKSTVTLWGWASEGEQIAVTPSWNTKPVSVVAGKDGKWTISIKTGKAGGPYSIRFAASNTIEVNNVLLGEVWLASGQSNMEFFMGKTSNGSYTGVVNYPEEIKAADYPFIRSIDVPNKVADEPQADFSGKWKICSPQTADTFSAVAYYFAREIYKATGYPIGIINATWGGTPAESWTRKEILENDSSFNVILERYKKQCDDYPAAYQKFKSEQDKWKADTSKAKGAAPREPLGPRHNNSPYKLYNGMIAPLLSYTIKGVIWYQGEGNAGRAAQYRHLFPAMIENWRTDFNNKKMPFYFVQISPHRSQNPEIRDAQLFTLQHVPYTGMAVTTDNGDSLDIHPRNKKLVGERLSLWALKNDYGKKDILASGPLYKSMKAEGHKLRVSFDDAAGLAAKDGEVKEFTIAGEDENFVAAKAVVEGNTILVWSDAVEKPVAVRFAWRNVPMPNLYNKAGLPASPFRTDSWKLTTEGKN